MKVKFNRAQTLLTLLLLLPALPAAASAKSISDLRLGNVLLGYHLTGGVEATGLASGASASAKDSFAGFTLGLRKQGFRFFGNRARLTWDTSLVLASFESGLSSPAPGQAWSLEGTLLNIRTGPGIEVRLADSLLAKLGTGMDTAFLDARLDARSTSVFSASSFSSRGRDWHFGGHVDGALFYVPNHMFSVYAGGGLEHIGEQTLGERTDQATLDLSSNWTLSTGMLFRW